MKKFIIVGSGRQGLAVAYDLLRDCNHSVSLVDINQTFLDRGFEKLSKISNISNLSCIKADVSNYNDMFNILKNADVMISAVPYEFNLELTKVAIDSNTSMVDLGGHTNIVREQLAMDKKALLKGVTIVPDCGMGPGMNITMAVLATEILDQTDEIYICDGGLPQKPIAPWNYSLFFNIEGLTNEYDEQAYFLKDGEIVEVPCFEGIELINFEGIGELEAAVTSGGLSTMPWSFKNKIKVLENKTLRYKGHWEWMRAYRELGLFSRETVEFEGKNIVPRDLYHQLLEKKINHGRIEDVCLMKIKALGIKDNKKVTLSLDAIEYYDKGLDLTAMEKWTGWHISIMALEIAYNRINKGAISVENALKGHTFLDEAKKRDYNIKINLKER
jgi:lysine 6-dehydrogenase